MLLPPQHVFLLQSWKLWLSWGENRSNFQDSLACEVQDLSPLKGVCGHRRVRRTVRDKVGQPSSRSEVSRSQKCLCDRFWEKNMSSTRDPKEVLLLDLESCVVHEQ